MQTIRNNRLNASCFYQDGFTYKKQSTYKGIVTYACNKLSLDCKARGKLIDGRINLTRIHNHGVDPEEMEYQKSEKFKDNLWMETVTTEDQLRIIWDRLALLHPDAAVNLPFSSIERQMGRWRRQNHPEVPHTLNDYGNLINLEQWQKYRVYTSGELHVHTIVVNDTTSVTIFGDIQLLASLTEVTELFTDATFKVCPRDAGISQFLTIMGLIDDAPRPLVWALMTRKTTEAYTEVFQYFRDHLAPHIQPTVVHLDYEVAMRNAILGVYPNITFAHCYFHYCQAILKRLKLKGKPWLRNLASSDIYLAFYRKLLGLALLPAADIQEAFDWLIENTARDTLEFFGYDFLNYYRNNWLNQVERFCVYNVTNRTNNFIESYHRVLSIRFGVHPGIWAFTAKLKNFQETIQIEISSLNRGIPVRRVDRQEYVNRGQIINRMWELYANRALSIPRFLSCVNHISASFDNDILFNNPDQVNNLLTFPVHDTGTQPIHVENPVIIVPEFDNRFPVPIFRRNFNEEENFQIFILENIDLSLCRRCNCSILNVVALPCNHWFFCIACTFSLALQAFNTGTQLFCEICNNQCIFFKTMQVS